MAATGDARFPEAPLPPQGTPMWHVRDAELSLGRWRCRTIGDHSFTDSSVVDGPIDTGNSFVYGCSDVDTTGHSILSINPALLPDTPPIWFVALPERTQPSPAISLVAFITDDHEPGKVISDPEFFSMAVDTSQQVGAIRWWIDSGIVDQIFVAEQWRRKYVGRALIASAQCYQVHNGWTPRLSSNGRRTAMGQQYADAALFPDRFAPLDDPALPMDPQ